MTKGILWIDLEDSSPISAPMFSEKVHAHVTLRFGVDERDYREFLGRRVDVSLNYDCWDARIQACQVEILDPEVAVLCENLFPHITVSHSLLARPKDSNEMLEGEHQWDPMGGHVITGTVSLHPFS